MEKKVGTLYESISLKYLLSSGNTRVGISREHHDTCIICTCRLANLNNFVGDGSTESTGYHVFFLSLLDILHLLKNKFP
jgi:hypothetical protein